jgi:DNA invertase Pin-like site-specific DNA recombinase
LRAVQAPHARPRRVLGYARVSSELQGQGSSLRDQQATIAAYATAQGFPVPSFYTESESAIHEKNEKRDRIRALMSEVRSGDLVVCDKIDRWSRDPEFTYRSIREILAVGAKFYAVGDACDPSTPEGDTMLNFRVLFAKEEHKRIKARMVGTRKILRDQGYYVEGLAPFGYRRSMPKGTKGAEKNVLRVEEAEAALVRRAFRMCAGGSSLNEITDALGITKDRVAGAMRNRIYLGEIENSKGEWITGKHPAILDADLFTRAGAALDDRRLGGGGAYQGAAETSTWLLRDVARCFHCGARMSAAYAGTKDARRHYYLCSHRCVSEYVSVRRVESDAAPMIVARLEELREELARPPKPVPVARVAVDVAERRAKLQRRREALLEQNLDGHITRDGLRVAMAKIDAQVLALDAQAAAASKPAPLADPGARRAALRDVGAIAKAWRKATPEERRTIVGHLATSAKIAPGRLAFTWRSAAEMAEGSA